MALGSFIAIKYSIVAALALLFSMCLWSNRSMSRRTWHLPRPHAGKAEREGVRHGKINLRLDYFARA